MDNIEFTETDLMKDKILTYWNRILTQHFILFLTIGKKTFVNLMVTSIPTVVTHKTKNKIKLTIVK